MQRNITIAGLADHLDAVGLVEDLAHATPEERVGVDDQQAQRPAIRSIW